MSCELDHLVVGAATLAQGVAWCEATLGVTPGPGGRHALMATHNRLLALGGERYPRAYLEIIAVDPDAPPPGRPRWFGLDAPATQTALQASPRLLHLVARTPNVEMLRWGLVNLGLDPGRPLALERATPQGPLRWRLLVRDDGAIAADGALPTLIEWPAAHPADTLAPSPLRLDAVSLAGLAPRVAALLQLRGVDLVPGPAALAVELQTPRGPVRLSSA